MKTNSFLQALLESPVKKWMYCTDSFVQNFLYIVNVQTSIPPFQSQLQDSFMVAVAYVVCLVFIYSILTVLYTLNEIQHLPSHKDRIGGNQTIHQEQSE
jgi:hypothetical protein